MTLALAHSRGWLDYDELPESIPNSINPRSAIHRALVANPAAALPVDAARVCARDLEVPSGGGGVGSGQRRPNMNRAGVWAAAAAVLAWAMPTPAFAHCDALDGPVVQDARAALEKSDLAPALKWIHADAEPEVRQAFAQAIAVRALGPEPKALADRHFFETLVRLHRVGEGAAYTGLKPAGSPVDPAVSAADEALECQCVDALRRLIATKVDYGLEHRLHRVLTARRRAGESAERGREYVAAYTEFVHYAERLHQAAAGDAGHSEPRETRASPR